jgi:Arylsulfotransferase (ASST)
MILFLVSCGRLQLSEVPDVHGAAWEAAGATSVRCEADGDLRQGTGEGSGTIRGLLAGLHYRCTATGPDGDQGTVGWTPPDPAEDLPIPRVELADPEAGFFLVNAFGDATSESSFALILDGQGQVRWERRVSGRIKDMDLSWVGEDILAGGGELRPQLWSLDGATLWSPDVPIEEDGFRWHHDSGLNEAGDGLLALAKEFYTFSNGDTTEEGVAIEEYSLLTGEQTWRWSLAEDGPGLERLADPRHAADPFHANSVFERDGVIYLSIRKADAVVLIEKQSKEVLGVLGAGQDFVLLDDVGEITPDSRWFIDQHDVQVHDDLLTVYSNASPATGFQVQRYRLDREAKTAWIEDEWMVEGGKPWYSSLLGGVDPVDGGGYSVAFGDPDGPFPSTLFLVDAEGSIRYQVSFPNNVGIYRSERRIAW